MQKKNKENKLVYFKYYQGISEESKNVVKNTVKEFYNAVGCKTHFVNGYTFNIVNEYKDINVSSPFTRRLKRFSDFYTKTMGATIAPELNKGKKEIVLQLKERKFPRKIWKSNVEKKYIECSILHEIGHNFDAYYGQQLDSEKEFDFDARTDVICAKKFLLSNTPQFIEAVNKDSLIIERIKSRKKRMLKYSQNYLDNMLSDEAVEIQFNGINQSDNSRSELFAQLFAYAFGKDDGNRDYSVAIYYNSYVLVKNYIKQYIGVNFNY